MDKLFMRTQGAADCAAFEGISDLPAKRASAGSGYFLYIRILIVCLVLATTESQLRAEEPGSGPSPQQPSQTAGVEPTGMQLRWYNPIERDREGRTGRADFGITPKQLSDRLGLSDCEGKVCFLSPTLGAGWFADFGPELAGVFAVTVHFAEGGLYFIEANFLSSFYDFLEPKLLERYGEPTFTHTSPERNQEVREWRVGDIRVRLTKGWYLGNSDRGSLSLRDERLSPEPPRVPELPF